MIKKIDFRCAHWKEGRDYWPRTLLSTPGAGTWHLRGNSEHETLLGKRRADGEENYALRQSSDVLIDWSCRVHSLISRPATISGVCVEDRHSGFRSDSIRQMIVWASTDFYGSCLRHPRICRRSTTRLLYQTLSNSYLSYYPRLH